jgi:hypothetical protein
MGFQVSVTLVFPAVAITPAGTVEAILGLLLTGFFEQNAIQRNTRLEE